MKKKFVIIEEGLSESALSKIELSTLYGGVSDKTCAAVMCGAALCGGYYCPADACGGALCGADGCLIALCGGNVCGGNACFLQLCPADACYGDACLVDFFYQQPTTPSAINANTNAIAGTINRVF